MIYEAIADGGVRRVAIAGIAKHAGKTTAMNELIKRASGAGRRIGIVSIGVDGERSDAIMGVPKPEVHVPAGALVASAGDVLTAGSAALRILEKTGISSTLGDVYLAEVTQSGTVLLAGVRFAAQVAEVLERLEANGADLCLVDGAFDRMMAASPRLTDGVVLATGAVVAKTVDEVVRQSVYFLQRFSLPVADEEAGGLLDLAEERGELIVGVANTPGGGTIAACTGSLAADETRRWQPVALTAKSTFTVNPQADPAWPGESARVLAVSGAVTDRLLAQLEGMARGFTLVMPDATHCFVSAAAWRKWLRRGHELAVRRPVNVLGLAVNPHSVAGYDLPRGELLAQMRTAVSGSWPELPVVDVRGSGEE